MLSDSQIGIREPAATCYKAYSALSETPKKPPTADQVAAMASRGEDASQWFTNKFSVVRPIRRVNIDLIQGMLRELDERATRLNISRQVVIKTLLAAALQGEQQKKLGPEA